MMFGQIDLTVKEAREAKIEEYLTENFKEESKKIPSLDFHFFGLS